MSSEFSDNTSEITTANSEQEIEKKMGHHKINSPFLGTNLKIGNQI